MVRQMFELGILQSGFWHQFAMTVHSPVGMHPELFNVIPHKNEVTFANNDVVYTDKTGIDHEKFSFGLKKSLFNYMHAIGFDFPLQEWFDFKIPQTKINPDFIYNALQEPKSLELKPNLRVFWNGNLPVASHFTKTKKGNSWQMIQLDFHSKSGFYSLQFDKEIGEWLLYIFEKCKIENSQNMTISKIKQDFELKFENFEIFWFSKNMETVKLSDTILIF
jgi:hypothetical protein